MELKIEHISKRFKDKMAVSEILEGGIADEAFPRQQQ